MNECIIQNSNEDLVLNLYIPDFHSKVWLAYHCMNCDRLKSLRFVVLLDKILISNVFN